MSSFVNLEQLEADIALLLTAQGMLTLWQIYYALIVTYPGIAPATVHDALNNLLSSAQVDLLPLGTDTYYKPLS